MTHLMTETVELRLNHTATSIQKNLRDLGETYSLQVIQYVLEEYFKPCKTIQVEGNIVNLYASDDYTAICEQVRSHVRKRSSILDSLQGKNVEEVLVTVSQLAKRKHEGVEARALTKRLNREIQRQNILPVQVQSRGSVKTYYYREQDLLPLYQILTDTTNNLKNLRSNKTSHQVMKLLGISGPALYHLAEICGIKAFWHNNKCYWAKEQVLRIEKTNEMIKSLRGKDEQKQ